MGEAILGIFLLVAGGFLACIVVEIAAGRDKLGARIGLGIGLALLDIVIFIFFLQAYMAASVALSPGSSSGPAGLIPIVAVPWILPAVRLWRLKRTPPPANHP